MASSSRRWASASAWMDMNSLPRWLISITDIPDPFQSSISSAAWRKTGSGRAAGPGLKLNGRVMVRIIEPHLRRCSPRQCLVVAAQASCDVAHVADAEEGQFFHHQARHDLCLLRSLQGRLDRQQFLLADQEREQA